jgi:choline dehydrogenase-like flavoprotein
MISTMPTLKNPRHERFCQLRAEGKSAAEAYAEAGYLADYANAGRLTRNDQIERRISELQARAARKSEVTVASLVDELEEAREAAHSAEQFSAATQAILGKAKLAGLLRDKVEIGGVGEFDHVETIEDVVRILMAEHDDPRDCLAMLDLMRELVIRLLGEQAKLLPEMQSGGYDIVSD